MSDKTEITRLEKRIAYLNRCTRTLDALPGALAGCPSVAAAVATHVEHNAPGMRPVELGEVLNVAQAALAAEAAHCSIQNTALRLSAHGPITYPAESPPLAVEVPAGGAARVMHIAGADPFKPASRDGFSWLQVVEGSARGLWVADIIIGNRSQFVDPEGGGVPLGVLCAYDSDPLFEVMPPGTPITLKLENRTNEPIAIALVIQGYASRMADARDARAQPHSVKFTDPEFAVIRDHAATCGKSAHQWMRDTLLAVASTVPAGWEAVSAAEGGEFECMGCGAALDRALEPCAACGKTIAVRRGLNGKPWRWRP